MKLKPLLLAAVVAAGSVLGGCSLSYNDNELLHPPKTTGREAEIQKLIEQTAKGNYLLKYPKTGAYRSAIITEDLNGDKNDEAIAFYRTDGDNAKTHMLVMYNEGKKWKLSLDFETDYLDIDCVQFADYDYDGVSEIFTGFVTFNNSINELNIFDYSPSDHKSRKVNFKLNYNAFTTGDYDEDGASELLSFTLGSNDSEALAILTDYDKNRLYTLSKCYMDNTVTKFEHVSSGLIGGKTTGVAIDGLVESAYNTQVIYYLPEKKKLINFPYNPKNPASNPTTRTYNIRCDDVDDDGFIEIPVIGEPVVKYDSTEEAIAPIISWGSLNPLTAKLADDIRCLTNFEFGYNFTIPKNFSGNIAATLSGDNRTMKIYALNGTQLGGLILTLKVFNVGANSSQDYSTIESYNQYSYTYKIEPNSPIAVNDQTVKENFALIETGA